MLRFFTRRLHDHDRGFTLIELLIVIAIIAILAAVLIPNFLRSRAQAQVSASKSNMRNIATALESYAADNNGSYPDQSEWDTALTNGGYMRAVPTVPGTTQPYTYVTGGNPPSYALCEDITLARLGSSNPALVYRPDRGFTEEQECPQAP